MFIIEVKTSNTWIKLIDFGDFPKAKLAREALLHYVLDQTILENGPDYRVININNPGRAVYMFRSIDLLKMKNNKHLQEKNQFVNNKNVLC